jgi:HSP20 family protein
MTDQTKSHELVSTGPLATRKARVPSLHENERQELGEMRERRLYAPRADIVETSDEFYVIADLPGVDQRSVEVNLDKNILTITAHPTIEVPQGYNLSYSEYVPGDYERRFVLSDMIERDKIEANVKNGVLYLHLPKAGHAKARRITVRAG